VEVVTTTGRNGLTLRCKIRGDSLAGREFYFEFSYMCISICMYVCMYVYIYIYLHVYMVMYVGHSHLNFVLFIKVGFSDGQWYTRQKQAITEARPHTLVA
jgi:hypothetical protein